MGLDTRKLGAYVSEPMGMRTEFKRARTDAGLSLEGLARKIECSLTTVWAIEQGRTIPNLNTAQALARALGKTVEELFPESEEAPA